MTPLTVGDQLRSQVCATQVVVVKAPMTPLEVTCGGAPMLGPSDVAVDVAPDTAPGVGGTLLGKRYADERLGLELLCVKGGAGTLAAGGAPLELKAARSLPASD
jgi:hypothetical protein